MTFYLGTHQVAWLKRYDWPMFVSWSVLGKYKTLPVALGPWCLDSGGFTALNKHGRWLRTPKTYSYFVERCATEIGGLQWAAPMDWMCESSVLAKTGLSVRQHQEKTIESFLWLQDRVGNLVVPVLQGWTIAEYLRHIEMYLAADVNLWAQHTVGVGSVCRRGQTSEIVKILRTLGEEDLPLHAFGVKGDALRMVRGVLVSADSMAWSFQGRHSPPLKGCKGHINCANCPKYAEQWRDKLLASLEVAA